jgi:hypothetical protein
MIYVQEQLAIEVKVSKNKKKVVINVSGEEEITLDDIEAVLIHIIEMSMPDEENLDRH